MSEAQAKKSNADPKWLKKIASPVIYTWGGFYLMILLVVGTYAQADLGLWLSQKIYFSSWLIWCFDMIPVPGGRLSMAVVFLSLLAFMFRKQVWKKPGILIVHMGMLLLLLGGFVTAYWRIEGNMVIARGETAQALVSYDQSELAFVKEGKAAHDTIIAYTGPILKDGAVLEHEQLPFKVELARWHEHCAPARLQGEAPADAKGAAQRFQLNDVIRPESAERYRRGAEFRLSGHPDVEGSYLIYEHMEVEQTLQIGEDTWRVGIRRANLPLPFGLKLKKFTMEHYPGTEMAKSYSSEVLLRDDGQERRVLIEMNQPLRHQGYTFYQSSFIPDPQQGGYMTVLAVVKDWGQMFPYISSLIMCIGLLIHLIQVVPKAFTEQETVK